MFPASASRIASLSKPLESLQKDSKVSKNKVKSQFKSMISAKEVTMFPASASGMASLSKPLESLQKESKVSKNKVCAR